MNSSVDLRQDHVNREGTPPAAVVRTSPFSRVINLIGAAVVLAFVLIAYWQSGGSGLTLGFVLVIASILLWAVVMFLPDRLDHVSVLLLVIMILAGSAATWTTDGLSIAPVIGGVVQLTARRGLTAIPGYVTAGAAGLIIALGSIVQNIRGVDTVSAGGLLAMEAGILVAVLGGVMRRQSRLREAAARETAALADRQALARELHDVLAHSLGGLVIQLDATDAQLEAGQVEKARARLGDAREMAASGLAEARRAVEALRATPAQGEGRATVAGADVVVQLGELVRSHEGLDGQAEYDIIGTPSAVDDETAVALRRALQESLSNARKHAPGQPVTVRLTWTRETVELMVTSPLPIHTDGSTTEARSTRMLAASGAGRGLTGMRERFDALQGGSVSYGENDGAFEVCATARVEVNG